MQPQPNTHGTSWRSPACTRITVFSNNNWSFQLRSCRRSQLHSSQVHASQLTSPFVSSNRGVTNLQAFASADSSSQGHQQTTDQQQEPETSSTSAAFLTDYAFKSPLSHEVSSSDSAAATAGDVLLSSQASKRALPATHTVHPVISIARAAFTAFMGALTFPIFFLVAILKLLLERWKAQSPARKNLAAIEKSARLVSDDDPNSAEKHAELLGFLNQNFGSMEVIDRVESKAYATNAAVVVEYFKAVNLTSASKYGMTGFADDGMLSERLNVLIQQLKVKQPLERRTPWEKKCTSFQRFLMKIPILYFHVLAMQLAVGIARGLFTGAT